MGAGRKFQELINPSPSNMGEGFINWGYTVVEKDSTFFYALLYVVL